MVLETLKTKCRKCSTNLPMRLSMRPLTTDWNHSFSWFNYYETEKYEQKIWNNLADKNIYDSLIAVLVSNKTLLL